MNKSPVAKPSFSPLAHISGMAFLAALLVFPVQTAPALASIEFRITDHRPGIAQFDWLAVSLRQVALHQKGSSRREGWFDVLSVSPSVDIVPLKDGLTKSLGEGRVPVGRYDAIRIRFATVAGALHDGTSPALRARDTVVAIDLKVSEKTNPPVVLDLYAEDQTEHEVPWYVVKVKEVRYGD